MSKTQNCLPKIFPMYKNTATNPVPYILSPDIFQERSQNCSQEAHKIQQSIDFNLSPDIFAESAEESLRKVEHNNKKSIHTTTKQSASQNRDDQSLRYVGMSEKTTTNMWTKEGAVKFIDRRSELSNTNNQKNNIDTLEENYKPKTSLKQYDTAVDDDETFCDVVTFCDAFEQPMVFPVEEECSLFISRQRYVKFIKIFHSL